MIVLQHRVERSDLRTIRIVSTAVGDAADALASRPLVSTDEWRHLMLALLPHPHVFGIVAAAAALVDGQLATCTKASAVLAATGFGLEPRGVMQTTANPGVRRTTDAKCRIKRPSELRAAAK